MTPSVDGVDRAVGGITSEDVKVLEDALTQARSSARLQQLDELIDKASVWFDGAVSSASKRLF